MQKRGGISSVMFRAERFFTSNGGWYFSIRNGEDMGPYPDRKEAEMELSFFLLAHGEWQHGLQSYVAELEALSQTL